MCDMAVGQNQWYHFGVGAPPILVFFSGDWDAHWGYGILTQGHMLNGSKCLFWGNLKGFAQSLLSTQICKVSEEDVDILMEEVNICSPNWRCGWANWIPESLTWHSPQVTRDLSVLCSNFGGLFVVREPGPPEKGHFLGLPVVPFYQLFLGRVALPK